MVSLIALSPCAGLLPIEAGTVSLSEVEVAQMFSVAPYDKKQTAVSKALKEQIGVALPAMGRMVSEGGVTARWFGHGVWMVNAPVTLEGLAAVTDQSDAWAVVRLEGADCEKVLARLVPLDLRVAHFKTGHVARSMLGHMTVSVARVAADAFEIMVMRSMAGTLVHDLHAAMTGVASR